jgi:hypothetical protein
MNKSHDFGWLIPQRRIMTIGTEPNLEKLGTHSSENFEISLNPISKFF